MQFWGYQRDRCQLAAGFLRSRLSHKSLLLLSGEFLDLCDRYTKRDVSSKVLCRNLWKRVSIFLALQKDRIPWQASNCEVLEENHVAV